MVNWQLLRHRWHHRQEIKYVILTLLKQAERIRNGVGHGPIRRLHPFRQPRKNLSGRCGLVGCSNGDNIWIFVVLDRRARSVAGIGEWSQFCRRRLTDRSRGAVLPSAVWCLPIALLGPGGSVCAIVNARPLAGNQGADIVHEYGDRAVDIRIWRLLQEIADLIHPFQQ